MKTLKDMFEVYRPKAKGEQDFVDKHVVIKHKDRNGNGDDVFTGNTKVVNRKKERHGYDTGADEKVYEEVEDLDEAVSISHDRYLRSHGKKASGSGAWIFTNKKNGNIDLDDHKKSHIGKGKFSDAAKSAKKWAKEHGHTTVYVAEDFNEDVVRNSILEMAEIEGVDLTEEQINDLVFSLIEDVEELDELSNKTLTSYSDKALKDRDEKHKIAVGTKNNKWDQRTKGMFRSAMKIKNEEVEELDELSKKTLGSYIKKAQGKQVDAGYAFAKSYGKDDKKENDAIRSVGNKSIGISRAVNKLTKEDVINNAIAKYATIDEANLPTREERLVSKLDGLSEGHVITLLTVFNGLNEDNQMKMLAAANTHEGIQNLLDFAIQTKEA